MALLHLFWIGLLSLGIQDVEAVRCFQCSHYPTPALCTDVTTCTTDEDCYVEELVTTSGLVLYNSGCISKDRCQILNSIMGKRSSDITTCKECCHGDLCNNAGCSKTAIPRPQRGPYCFSCDLMTEPNHCEKLSICGTDEICLIHIPPEFQSYPTPLYRAQCESVDACAPLPKTVGICPATCCDTDFCNDHCINGTATTTMATTTTVLSTEPLAVSSKGQLLQDPTTPVITTESSASSSTSTKSTTASISTKSPIPKSTTAPTSRMPTTVHGPSGPRCRQPYHHISDTNLCIQLFGHTATWLNARKDCMHRGGDLLMLKTDQQRTALLAYLHRLFGSGQGSDFWIGIYHSNGQFRFVNGDIVQHTMWTGGHQTNFAQNCVRALHNDHLYWSDSQCFQHYPYICQFYPN